MNFQVHHCQWTSRFITANELPGSSLPMNFQVANELPGSSLPMNFQVHHCQWTSGAAADPECKKNFTWKNKKNSFQAWKKFFWVLKLEKIAFVRTRDFGGGRGIFFFVRTHDFGGAFVSVHDFVRRHDFRLRKSLWICLRKASWLFGRWSMLRKDSWLRKKAVIFFLRKKRWFQVKKSVFLY